MNICKDDKDGYALEAKKVAVENTWLTHVTSFFLVMHAGELRSKDSVSYKVEENTYGYGGALSFYLTQAHAFYDGNKRAALITSVTFLNLNGWDLEYLQPKEGHSELSVVINSVA